MCKIISILNDFSCVSFDLRIFFPLLFIDKLKKKCWCWMTYWNDSEWRLGGLGGGDNKTDILASKQVQRLLKIKKLPSETLTLHIFDHFCTFVLKTWWYQMCESWSKLLLAFSLCNLYTDMSFFLFLLCLSHILWLTVHVLDASGLHSVCIHVQARLNCLSYTIDKKKKKTFSVYMHISCSLNDFMYKGFCMLICKLDDLCVAASQFDLICTILASQFDFSMLFFF